MRHIKYLIFDLDGTLIDSSEGVIDAVNYSLRMMGRPEQPPERIKPFIGYPLSQMYLEFTDAPVEELYRHFQVRASHTVVQSTVILDGVEDVLHTLKKRGFRMAIATTKIRRHVEGVVAKFGWKELFDALVGGDDVTQVKPAPEAFHVALQRLGASPENAIVIGDTVNDIAAARAVPMQVVGVLSPYGDPGDLETARPDHMIRTISDLPLLLERLNDRQEAPVMPAAWN